MVRSKTAQKIMLTFKTKYFNLCYAYRVLYRLSTKYRLSLYNCIKLQARLLYFIRYHLQQNRIERPLKLPCETIT